MIYLGADHAGFKVKQAVKAWLEKKGINLIDITPHFKEGDDYPQIAKKVAKLVVKQKGSIGILSCGSGTGMCIAANRIKGTRAAYVFDNYTARYARIDNDANIICLRQRMFKNQLRLVKTFLETPFSGKARHRRRIKQLDA